MNASTPLHKLAIFAALTLTQACGQVPEQSAFFDPDLASDPDVTVNEEILIFSYGTLKPGHRNYYRAGEVYSCWRDTVIAELYPVSGRDYPGAVALDQTSTIIEGFVLEVNRSQLRDIDRLEGYNPRTDNGLYRRRIATTGRGHRVYVYEYNASNLSRQESLTQWEPERDRPELCESNDL